MTFLALETSTSIVSVALWHDGQCHSYTKDYPKKASEVLLPTVDSLMKAAKLSVRNLTGIAFSAGPGSFTGLRLSAAIAQGMGQALDVPTIGVSSLLSLGLDCVANNRNQQVISTNHDRVLACIDARKNEIYLGGYEFVRQSCENDSDEKAVPNLYKKNGLEKIFYQERIAPQAMIPSKVVEYIFDQVWQGCGNGFDYFPALKDEPQIASVLPASPSAMAVLMAAWTTLQAEIAQKKGFDVNLATLSYLRHKVALTKAERAVGRK